MSGHRCSECGQKIPPTPLSELFRKRGFAFRALAKEAGCSASTLSRMTHGQGVTLRNMQRVARVLDISLDDLAELIDAGRPKGEEGD